MLLRTGSRFLKFKVNIGHCNANSGKGPWAGDTQTHTHLPSWPPQPLVAWPTTLKQHARTLPGQRQRHQKPSHIHLRGAALLTETGNQRRALPRAHKTRTHTHTAVPCPVPRSGASSQGIQPWQKHLVAVLASVCFKAH